MPEKPQTVDEIEMDELFSYTQAEKTELRDNISNKKTAPMPTSNDSNNQTHGAAYFRFTNKKNFEE